MNPNPGLRIHCPGPRDLLGKQKKSIPTSSVPLFACFRWSLRGVKGRYFCCSAECWVFRFWWIFMLCLPCCTKTTASHKSHQQAACIRRCSCGCYIQNNYWESHRTREKGQVPYVVCGTCVAGFLLASPPFGDWLSIPLGAGHHPQHPLYSPHPQIFVGQKFAAQEIFGLEIFLEQQIFGKYCPSKILERNNSWKYSL